MSGSEYTGLPILLIDVLAFVILIAVCRYYETR
jgi:hypothetical protein